jgi:deazaflavin-dependent oxidoreductase (nitroreductase family)
MAKQYEATQGVNRLTSWLARRGWGRVEVMTTTGRKSGSPRQVPVSPIVVDGEEYLVSPYGVVSWVRNVRARPIVTLRHGKVHREVRLDEVTGAPAAPVVAAYYARESHPRPYMDVPESPTVSDFAERAEQFPVFRVGPVA